MTLTYTPRLKLAVPDFLTEPWHGEFAQAMESIDRALYDALLVQLANLWLNSTAYVVGNVVISPDNGTLYTCAVAHTSSAFPQTFTAELVAHPTFWTPTAPSLATQAEAEAGVDNTKFMSPLRTKQAFTALTFATAIFTPRAGRLTRTSATQLNYSPYNGNLIKINGNLYEIPVAGIAGLANTGVDVAGTPGQNLAANTNYYVYAHVVSGVVRGNYTTNGHRPSQTIGNEGVEVEWDGVSIEFPGSTLIGFIRTNGSAQFDDSLTTRHVRSWFNDPGITLFNGFTTSRAVASSTFVEIHSEARVNWLNWTGETLFFHFTGPIFSTGGVAATAYLSLGIDSTTAPQDVFTKRDTFADTKSEDMTAAVISLPSEGNHFATPLARSFSAISITLAVEVNSAGARPTISAYAGPRG